jgi:hypothetical protein
MSNGSFWSKSDSAPGIPHAAAQIDFLELVKELFVESA